MAEPETVSPYVGPYAFTEEDAERFFGRDREAEALLALVIAERVTVLCSPSGAGKSSLVNARLVPDLHRRGFSVLPVARVSGEPPAGVSPDNVYVYNVLSTLSADRLAASETLAGFLHPSRWGADGERPPRVLVLDQLEEIVTTHPDRWHDRTDLFLQLRRALLDDPALSVLLVLREDHLAGLDPWAHLLPGQLRTRLRLERLHRDEALDAVRRPAEAAGRPFAPGVAEALVDDLSQLHLAGRKETVAGELVEPVQLQVVCFQLWENLRRRPGDEITALDLLDSGDIDRALESFYESAVRRAAATGAPEALIRHWCGTRLITPTRVRAQVARDAEVSWGLPNAAVDALVDAHLIRAEVARGGTWYELAHDRFIEPVLSSNKRAAPEVVRRLSKDARSWHEKAKDASYLYSGEQLAEALAAVAGLQELLPPSEREFLAAAQKQEGITQRKKTRRLRAGLATLIVLVVGLAGLTVALYRTSLQSHSRELASAAVRQAQVDPDLGLRLALEAIRKAETLEAEEALHQTLRLSEVRRLGSIKIAPDTARAVAFHPDGERIAAVGLDGRLGIWDTGSGRRLAQPAGHEAIVTAVAFDPAGNLLASGDRNGRVVLWRADSAEVPRSFDLGSLVNALAFSPDATLLAVATDEPEVTIWDVARANRVLDLAGRHRDFVRDVAFSADGRQIATASEDGLVIVWSLDAGQPAFPPLEHGVPVRRVAFGPDGRLATASEDLSARIWRTGDPGAGMFLERSLPHDAGDLWDVAFSPDGSQLVTASSDGKARIWNLSSGTEVRELVPGEGQLRRIAFVAEGRRVATAAEAPLGMLNRNALVMLWSVAPAPATVARHAKVLGFVRDGRAVATVDRGGGMSLWSLEGRALDSPGLRELAADGVSFAATESLIALGRPTGELEVVDLEAKAAPYRFRAQSGPFNALALSSRGRLLAAGADGATTRLWELEPVPTLIQEFEHSTIVVDLAFSADSRHLAIGGEDGTLTVWELEGRRSLFTRKGHKDEVVQVAFSPDDLRLASAGTDGTVKVWSLPQGRELFALPSPSPVADLAFPGPGGEALAIVDAKGLVRLEPTRLSDLMDRARSRRPRLLTLDECRLYLRPWSRTCSQDTARGSSGEP